MFIQLGISQTELLQCVSLFQAEPSVIPAAMSPCLMPVGVQLQQTPVSVHGRGSYRTGWRTSESSVMILWTSVTKVAEVDRSVKPAPLKLSD